jgi:hypothetical protein
MEEVINAMNNKEIAGALLDMYAAATKKGMFDGGDIQLNRLLQYPTGYGFVLSGDMSKAAPLFRQALAAKKTKVSSIVEENTDAISQVCKFHCKQDKAEGNNVKNEFFGVTFGTNSKENNTGKALTGSDKLISRNFRRGCPHFLNKLTVQSMMVPCKLIIIFPGRDVQKLESLLIQACMMVCCPVAV